MRQTDTPYRQGGRAEKTGHGDVSVSIIIPSKKQRPEARIWYPKCEAKRQLTIPAASRSSRQATSRQHIRRLALHGAHDTTVPASDGTCEEAEQCKQQGATNRANTGQGKGAQRAQASHSDTEKQLLHHAPQELGLDLLPHPELRLHVWPRATLRCGHAPGGDLLLTGEPLCRSRPRRASGCRGRATPRTQHGRSRMPGKTAQTAPP